MVCPEKFSCVWKVGGWPAPPGGGAGGYLGVKGDTSSVEERSDLGVLAEAWAVDHLRVGEAKAWPWIGWGEMGVNVVPTKQFEMSRRDVSWLVVSLFENIKQSLIKVNVVPVNPFNWRVLSHLHDKYNMIVKVHKISKKWIFHF